ncbi:MAG TPA: adenylate kinase [Armatimonadetes bacterium]|nr:adenylate kinase [Armatimonadota bacterium]
MRIVMLGGPGAGKGTHAGYISERLGIPHIASGDILREEVALGTDLGKKAKSYMERGLLVPDDLVEGMIARRLSRPDAERGFILDGFPRTVEQARWLERFLKGNGWGLDAVVNLVVPDWKIIRRLANRRICKNCGAIYNLVTMPPKRDMVCDKCGGELYQRRDDREEVVRERLRVYRKQTAPLVAYYRGRGLLVNVFDLGEEDVRSQEVLEAAVSKAEGRRKARGKG